MEMSPAQILLLFEQSERDRAETALWQLDATYAAVAPGVFEKGGEVLTKVRDAFRRMAGLDSAKPSKKDAKANRKGMLDTLRSLGAGGN